ncbi:PQQ-dependent sugar dehydrogenase [Kineobactrum salinum]|uniref:Glucose/Sorbosone dehydrogenase domain-containing protein n=1 Tax=Kineobactrum salinum TaxID=2708301 RepID=A0A6C0U1M2_9GAMM|nr:PQQ-dependent sugar dehydrogenase [Kineobactrum salinum]QIB65941.1 hypothetical protein G3T16_11420 [Kineobactrum salinum]
MVRIFKLIPVLILAFAGACGGGSGGDEGPPGAPQPPPPGEPFGLTERESLAPLSLPGEPVSPGSLSLRQRYPALNFPGALFLAAVPGEDRLAVVRQSGRLEVFEQADTVASKRTVLNLEQRVLFAGEQGLLGLAFDPDFAGNRYIYLHYSAAEPRRSVISRFHWPVQSDLVDPASEKIILEVAQPFANHNGGMLAFGPDDMLYIALGDGGGGGDPRNNGQDTTTLLGSLLRIDVHPADPALPYAVPLDNPFVDDPAVRDEIWAYGLRNPYRFSFDRATGELWLGDVGQGALEEIDIVRAGDNLGWRVFEGTQRFDGSANMLPDNAFTPPVFEYGRAEGIAVIGGYVYRGSALPSLLGHYIYTDFGSGTVWALDYDGERVLSNQVIATADTPTSLGEDHAGEVFVVSRQGGLFGFTETGGGEIPDRLSKTGLFTDLVQLAPADGLVEYAVNHPFWSDGASKRRWIGLPGNSRITFSAADSWDFPAGTVIVKHFEILLDEADPQSLRRLETRVLVNGEGGWRGFTYRWDEAQQDAVLLSGRETQQLTLRNSAGVQREQLYTYPGRSDCLRCHTAAAGRVLGIRSAQLNGNFDYDGTVDNQLRSWNNIQLFSQDIGAASQYPAFAGPEDSAASVSDRARAYLDVNCAHCHRPNGPTPVDLDLRAGIDLAAMNAVNEMPQSGGLYSVDARIIVPGERDHSILWQRMLRRDSQAMPPLSSHRVDEMGSELVGRWIDQL